MLRLLFVVFLAATTVAQFESKAVPPAAGGQQVSSTELIKPPAATARTAAGKTLPLPLIFEENRGQADTRFDFVARARNHSILVSPSRILIAGREGSAELLFAGADCAAHPSATDPSTAQVSYFTGSDARRWLRGIPAHSRVRYRNVYPGIDALWYGRDGSLEFDLIVSPDADPGRVALRLLGGTASIRSDGVLLWKVPGGDVEIRRPIAYQEDAGTRKPVHAAWLRRESDTFGLRIGDYDRGQTLVVDPVLVYSSYLGASDSAVSAVALDASGNIHVVGQTASGVFGAGSLSHPPSGHSEAFIAKLDPSGSNLIYAAYIGGNADEVASAVRVDGAGNAIVAGTTNSGTFPTVRAWQPTLAGSADAFIAKLNPQGTELIFSTYVGGSATDEGRGVAVDAAGAAYVVGATRSQVLPATPSTLPGYQRNLAGATDAFACKLDPDGKPVYVTMLGGGDGDEAYGAAVDSSGHLYITGVARSANFPVANALQGTAPASENVFVTKLAADGASLVYSTYLNGQGGGDGIAIAVDGSGAAYVTGMAMSGFPAVNALARCDAAQAFAAKLAPNGSKIEYSTCFGGSNTSSGHGIFVDGSGSAYVTGYTDSGDFPLVDALQRSIGSSVAFKSTDAGATWTQVSNGLRNLNVLSLAIDPSRPSTLYAVVAGGGIAKSTDSAGTWVPVNNGLDPTSTCGLAMAAQRPSTLYTASRGILYRTTDGASSWQPVAPGVYCVWAADPQAPETVYVQGEAGLHKSTDGGRTLTRIGTGIPSAAYLQTLVIDPGNSGVLYAGTPGFGAFKSTDGGATFSAMQVDSNVYALAVAPSDSNTVYAGTRFGVYTSKDGGRTWEMPFGAIFDRVYSLSVDPKNASIVYAGTRDSGIRKSTDGGNSFAEASTGITSPRIWAIAIDPSDSSRVYAGAVAAGDAFVARLDPSGSRLLFSTFLGGQREDDATGIAVDASGAIYVAGTTESGDLPLASPRHSRLDHDLDGFIAKIVATADVSQLVCTSAASFAANAPVAPDSIATVMGSGLAPYAAWASTLPLPVELAGAKLKISDSSGAERFAPLFYVSPDQLNFLVPEGTRPGAATLAAMRDGAVVGMGAAQIADVAPALFAANSNGRGVAAATAVRVAATGVQTPVAVFDCPSGAGSCVPVPMDLGGPADQLIVSLYGTGIPGRPVNVPVLAAIADMPAVVLYAGPQAGVGVDQVNVVIPRGLAGRGEVFVQLTVGGNLANAVTVAVK